MDETRRYSFSSTTNFGVWTNRERGNCNSLVYAMIGRIISAIVAFFFATVGCLVGCMVGAIIGHATETGFFRGAGVGAITGAVFSIEAFESSVVLWRSDDTGMKSVLYTIDIIASLISGRLVRERVGISMMNAVQSQMITVELEAAFEETHDIFETEGPRGLPEETVEKIPKLTITEKNRIDSSGEKLCCSVCLQDFQIGETVRRLPHCHHIFHLPCIDRWLLRHGSCPLCRRNL